MRQQKCTGLEHARCCATVVQYVPFLGLTGERLRLETEGDVLGHSCHCVPEGRAGSVAARGCKRGAQQLVGAHEQVFLPLCRD